MSTYNPRISAGTGFADENELAHTRDQSPTSYPELPQNWKSGLGIKDRLESKKYDFKDDERVKAREKDSTAVMAYRAEMVKRWGKEMDSLLVFAGLFSTVLTAFSVESYSLLAPTQPDPVLAALTQISAQLASFSVHDPFVNSTQPAFRPSSVSSDSTPTQAWAVWLNALWFSSLICSLSAASVAIMVKQWLHQYNSRISGETIHTTRFRQHRFNGLTKWKISEIIAVLPILLQIAFIQFLAGLLILLWTLSRTVAILASILVGTLLVFTLATIILATFFSNCAYISPLSISLYSLCRLIFMPIRTPICQIAYSVWLWADPKSRIWRIARWLVFSYKDASLTTVSAIDLAYVTQNSCKLDQDAFLGAYHTTGDVQLLDHVSTCFSDHSIDDLRKFFTRIHALNEEYGQFESFPHWTRSIPLDMASDMMLVSVHALNTDHSAPPALNTDHSVPPWPLETAAAYLSSCNVVRDGPNRIRCALSNMTAVLFNDGKAHPEDFPLYQCVLAVSKQLSHEETKAVLKDDLLLRKRLIAAIYTVIRKRDENLRQVELCECVQYLRILMHCCPPTISQSQPHDMAEEDTEWKPLTHAIALAEDLLIRTLHSHDFHKRKEPWPKCFDIDRFFRDHRDHFDLERLAKRLSKKLRDALAAAVEKLPHAQPDYGENWKRDHLRWLESIDLKARLSARQTDLEAGY